MTVFCKTLTIKGHQFWLRWLYKKVITFWHEKGWHHQLPHRRTPTLVLNFLFSSNCGLNPNSERDAQLYWDKQFRNGMVNLTPQGFVFCDPTNPPNFPTDLSRPADHKQNTDPIPPHPTPPENTHDDAKSWVFKMRYIDRPCCLIYFLKYKVS